MTAEEILEAYKKNEVFYKNGGITATGGEPLMQLDFLTELFQKAKKQGIHTCLDTSGIMYRKERQEKFVQLFKVLDLVLLDLSTAMKQVIKTLQVLDRSMCWNLPAFWKKKRISNDRPPCGGSGDHR